MAMTSFSALRTAVTAVPASTSAHAPPQLRRQRPRQYQADLDLEIRSAGPQRHQRAANTPADTAR